MATPDGMIVTPEQLQELSGMMVAYSIISGLLVGIAFQLGRDFARTVVDLIGSVLSKLFARHKQKNLQAHSPSAA